VQKFQKLTSFGVLKTEISNIPENDYLEKTDYLEKSGHKVLQCKSLAGYKSPIYTLNTPNKAKIFILGVN